MGINDLYFGRTPKKRRATRKKSHPTTKGGRPNTSRRRIFYTKFDQPYVLKYKNINGKRRKMAVFIKKSSARRSKKRKGGKY